MVTEKEINDVMKTLVRNKHKFITPALTEIAEQTEDPFQVLVSCILSLRTRDETTARVSKQLFSAARTPEKMAKMSAKEIRAIIKPVNYYKTKAKRIRKICQELVEKYGGKVPNDFDLLMKFKGVGRKTANIVMVYGFRGEGLPIDTHCHRIPNRLGWVKTKTPEKTEQALRAMLPKRHWLDFNDIFVQFGQNICSPVNPKCGECPISRHCQYYKTNRSKKTTSIVH